MKIKKLENGSFELSDIEINENGAVILSKEEIEKISDFCEADNTVDSLRKYFKEATQFPAEVNAETAQQYLNNDEMLPLMAQKMDMYMEECHNNWLEAVALASRDMYPILLEHELEKASAVKTQVDAVEYAGWKIEAQANTWHLSKHFPKGIELEFDARKGKLYDDVKKFISNFNASDFAEKQLILLHGIPEAGGYGFEVMLEHAPLIERANKLLVGYILAAMRIGLPEE